MMNPIALSIFFSQVMGGVVTIHRTSTVPAQTLTRTVYPDEEIISATTTTEVTLFQAVTTPLTIASGTIYTTIGTSKPAPVSQQSSYSHTSFSQEVDPSSYTAGITLTKATSNAVSSQSSSSTSSTSNTKTTSPEVSSSTTSTSTTTTSSSSSSSASSSLIGSSTVPSSSYSTSSGSSSTSPSSVTSSSSSAVSSSSSAATSSATSSGDNYYADQSNLFSAIDTSAPPSMFPRKGNGLSVPDNVQVSGPIQTNKFYANLFLGSQELTVFAQPYELFRSTDSYFGMGVSYVEASQRVFGSGDPPSFYTNPLMLKSWVYSAKEFTTSNTTVTSSNEFSVTAELTSDGSSGKVTFPIAIGMGMVTGIYSGDITPRLFSQIGVETLKQETGPVDGVQKYQATLFNGKIWNIYVTTSDDSFIFKADSDYDLVGSKAIDGLVVQVAVLPDGVTDDSSIDAAAGVYATSATLTGSVTNDVATYAIDYDTTGKSSSGSALLYALPHHVDSFTDATKEATVNITAYSQTKGYLTAVLSDKLEMAEPLYTDLQWLPYQVDNDNYGTYSSEALQLIASTLNSEISEDMEGQTQSASTYTAGKGLDKFAYIVLVASEILNDEAVAKQGLESLKTAISPWLNNTQLTPFIYDTNWKGVTSSANENDDYGAAWYNDHHFHYGYYVHTAAVIGMVDKKYGGTWAEDNKDWVNSLVRDVANPSSDDTYFPVSRMFDYFHGHSWAAGLWESGDGKNEESTSEDINFAYGMKLWGQVIGDATMEARGDLMLSILKRSMDKYFYYEDDNNVEPSNYIAHRVPGISYENKLAYTTFFGTNVEYIQGIQMIPITGASGLVRSKTFAEQEWDSLLSSVAPTLDSGWAGILYSGQTIFDPDSAYEWFSSSSFKSEYLDGGASRTWYLAMAAGLSSKY